MHPAEMDKKLGIHIEETSCGVIEERIMWALTSRAGLKHPRASRKAG
jgi:hypothetical protein